MPLIFDTHRNFGYSTIATAPVPAASGTTATVETGHGTRFVANANATVWPSGVLPTDDNAEIVRVTGIVGDVLTLTRIQESTSARSIAVGDQISQGITRKVIKDIESWPAPRWVPGGRLTLTTGTPVLANAGASGSTLIYTPYVSSLLELYDGSAAWDMLSYTELSIAIPNTTVTGYDAFVYNNGGTATLELTAWTNPATRATALTRQNGRLVKTGATTRLYLGSFETDTVAGQTSSTLTKRLLWNFYNRIRLPLLKAYADVSWPYGTSTVRQANASTANQVDVFVGVAEALMSLDLGVLGEQNDTKYAVVGFGEDVTNALSAEGTAGMIKSEASGLVNGNQGKASLRKYPASGRHFYPGLEWASGGTFTFYGTPGAASGPTGGNAGISGYIEG